MAFEGPRTGLPPRGRVSRPPHPPSQLPLNLALTVCQAPMRHTGPSGHSTGRWDPRSPVQQAPLNQGERGRAGPQPRARGALTRQCSSAHQVSRCPQGPASPLVLVQRPRGLPAPSRLCPHTASAPPPPDSVRAPPSPTPGPPTRSHVPFTVWLVNRRLIFSPTWLRARVFAPNKHGDDLFSLMTTACERGAAVGGLGVVPSERPSTRTPLPGPAGFPVRDRSPAWSPEKVWKMQSSAEKFGKCRAVRKRE